MWTESIRPLLLERQNCTLHSITLRVLGGESNLEYQGAGPAGPCQPHRRHLLQDRRMRDPHHGPCRLRRRTAKKCAAHYARKFYDLLGDAVYDEDVAGLEETVVRTLKEKGLSRLHRRELHRRHDRRAYHRQCQVPARCSATAL